ncbi:hypothetical protein RRG08_050912 [Elysia crispata]|uniref:Uncharacterized protein n=1 Tax=Elysia crispata TaxID=231223 RepID=A0AAE0ZSY7_9GAST|nr:hypothetical protein RRG08_050912 [Elysia crispata]
MTIPVLQSDCLWRTSCMDQIQPSVTAQVSSNKTIEPQYCLGDLPPAGTTNSETTRFYCVYHTRLVTGAESFRIVEMSRDKRQTLLTETSRRKAALLTDKLQLHVVSPMLEKNNDETTGLFFLCSTPSVFRVIVPLACGPSCLFSATSAVSRQTDDDLSGLRGDTTSPRPFKCLIADWRFSIIQIVRRLEHVSMPTADWLSGGCDTAYKRWLTAPSPALIGRRGTRGRG